MCGAIPPFPNTPSWHGAPLKIKHRDDLLFRMKQLCFNVLFASVSGESKLKRGK